MQIEVRENLEYTSMVLLIAIIDLIAIQNQFTISFKIDFRKTSFSFGIKFRQFIVNFTISL